MDVTDRYPGPVLRVAGAYAWRLIVVGVVVFFAARTLWNLKVVLIPVTLALLLVALLHPVLVFLSHRGLPRWLASIITLLFAVMVVGGILFIVISRAVDQAPQLATQVNRLIPHVKQWLITGPLHVNKASVDNFSNTLSKQVSKNANRIASTAVSTGKTVVDVLAGSVLAIFVTVFLLYDGERVWGFLVQGVPMPGRARVDTAGRAAWSTLSHYVRGTLIVAVYHGTVMAILLTALGVPLVAPLALIVALGSFVPIVGAVVTGLLAVGVAGITNGLGAAIVVAVTLVINNQVEAHLLQPFVVGRYIHLHPLATVMALAVGALVASIYGALIAVPLVGCANAFVRSIRSHPSALITPDGGPAPPADLADPSG